MKVSYNWLREYLPLEQPVEQVAESLTRLGLEVSGVEHRESIRGGLRGVVAGKVLTCEKHPNADRLSLTTVEIGTNSPLQIVCGAPNVAAGQTVWVATVGTVLYPGGADQVLKISKARVRGETSEGMICAADELGLGEDHSGILVLPDEIKAGTRATDYYHITSDDVIEVELTPNRSDATCHLGVARDLAAWDAIHGTGVRLKKPDIASGLRRSSDYQMHVEVRNSEACPRYCGVVLTGVRVTESPEWLQNRLRSIDLKPINNIVDITNFVLHEMGQPLHAFDADQISGRQVIVQTLPSDTPFVTLDHVERKLRDTDLMICDGQGRGMCIAGVYGGLGTGVTEKTSNVFLESAHFSPGWVRRTSMYHDLRTDAARTFEKTTDPNICRLAMIRAASLILEIAGGEVGSDILDIYPVVAEPAEIHVKWSAIEKLTGVSMSREEVRRIVAAMEMSVLHEDAEGIKVAVPTNKADVLREADLIEELLRIYGYDEVPIHPRLEISLNAASAVSLSELREEIGDFLAGLGFHEMMGMSLIESRDYEAGLLAIGMDQRILIANTSNVHLDLMRHQMLASALDAVRFNLNRMQTDLMLFEFGRTYQKQNGRFEETEHLTLSLSGRHQQAGWRQQEAESDFYVLKKYVGMLLDHLGITGIEVTQARGQHWEFGLEYTKGGVLICAFGKVHEALLREHEIRQPLYFADFEMTGLLELGHTNAVHIREISRFPEVRRDLAIVLGDEISYQQVEEVITRVGGENLIAHALFDVYQNPEVLGAGKRSLAVALTFQDTQKTLTDDEVNGVMKQIVAALESETGAVLR